MSRLSPSSSSRDVRMHGEPYLLEAEGSQVTGGPQETRPSQVQPASLLNFRGSIVDFGAPRSGRKFKACRSCRRHKLKCERNGDGVCQRCLGNGTECIFDSLNSRRRETFTKRDSALPTQNSSSAPQGYIADQATPYHNESPTRPVQGSQKTKQAGPGQLSPSVQSSPADGSGTNQLTPKTQPSELTSEDLRAPVSAMHNLSHHEESLRGLSNTPSDTYYSARVQPAPRLGTFFRGDACQTDPISRGFVGQRQARELFNGFMSCAINFLPIFDPILDSFETLRAKEPFCFTVILFLASCVEASPISHQCAQLVKDLMAASLFNYPASLGKVQGMILLVAYAESTWFAIGHTLQMALDIGLDSTLSREQIPDRTIPISHSENERQAVRSARVWLALCFLEREIAMGTAKPSRIPEVLDIELAHLACQSHTQPPNMRLASLVEAVQIRDHFMSIITSAKDLDATALQRLQHMRVRFDEWFEHWDALHKDCGYDQSSFQRTSLGGQNRYAMIFLGCATIGRITGNKRLSVAMKTIEPLPEILRLILAIAMDQLRRMGNELYHNVSHLYRYVPYGSDKTPSADALLAIFALEMSRHQEDINEQEVYSAVSAVAQILVEYHDLFFHRLIQARLDQRMGGPLTQGASQELSGRGNEDFGFEYLEGPSLAQHQADNRNTHGGQSQVSADGIRDETVSSARIELQGMNPPDSLDQFLENPDWMMNPSAMMVFDAARWQSQDPIEAHGQET